MRLTKLSTTTEYVIIYENSIQCIYTDHDGEIDSYSFKKVGVNGDDKLYDLIYINPEDLLKIRRMDQMESISYILNNKKEFTENELLNFNEFDNLYIFDNYYGTIRSNNGKYISKLITLRVFNDSRKKCDEIIDKLDKNYLQNTLIERINYLKLYELTFYILLPDSIYNELISKYHGEITKEMENETLKLMMQ